MASIELKKVSVEFPVFSWHGRSIKHEIVSHAVGGIIGSKQIIAQTVSALKHIDLEVKEGDRIGIVGHNGAGKTTLLRTISGIYHPTSGGIRVEGHIHSLIDIMLGVDHEATGRENIYLRGLIMGLSKKKIQSYEKEIIDFSELDSFIDLPIRTYSTGMVMRLAFAIATVVSADIIIMDEWLSVGDAEFRHKAQTRLYQLITASKILIVATHDEGLVKKLCNRRVKLEHGKIVSDEKLNLSSLDMTQESV